MKVYPPRTVLTLAGTVGTVMLLVQLLFQAPSIISDYQIKQSQLIDKERNRLEQLFAEREIDALLRSKDLLNRSLVGLVLTDDESKVILNRGNTLDYESIESSPDSSGFVKPVILILKTRNSRVNAKAFINRRSELFASIQRAFSDFALALALGLICSAVSLWGSLLYFVRPMNTLTSALRLSRENSKGQVPEPISVDIAEELTPIADEFNQLIAEQKKSSTQIKVKQQYLEFVAHRDSLTMLPNRLMFENSLKQTVQDALSEDLQFAVFLVDLDNFKFFNDQYGHLVGDKMVTEVGNRLRTMMREIDLVARLDGDEFVVIQKDAKCCDSITEVAKRIMSVVSAPYEYRGFTLKTAVSVGISNFPGDVRLNQDDALLGEEIVNNAAVALQEAKGHGKNQFQFFDEKMRSRLTARIRLEQDLKLALQDEQFEVFYQPKINIHTRQCTGAEALVRWRHPVNGFVSPDAFVPLAEETGLIIELGEWILQSACNKTYELQQMGYGALNVAVNISAVQFTDGNLLPMISNALENSQLRPEFLELEITESAVMHDPEFVINSLHELSEFGTKLAIDDFGTGYSSLAYLKRFPVDTLKIDRAFITDISNDYDDVAIVEAVLGLGKHFNMKVVAEGVEDEEQLNFLKMQGCDIAQGYFISKPLSAEKYLAWLERWPYGIQQSNASLVNDSILLAHDSSDGRYKKTG